MNPTLWKTKNRGNLKMSREEFLSDGKTRRAVIEILWINR